MTTDPKAPSDPAVQDAVKLEFMALADLLAAEPETTWDAPSLCEAWRVREVVAHMTMPARYDEAAFMSELQARNYDFGRVSNELAARDGGLPIDELIADLRSDTLHQWVPPQGGAHGALNHAVIHGLDVTVPIRASRRPDDETMKVVLDDLTRGGGHEHFGTEITGRLLQATDLPWTYGSGESLRGSAVDLALVLCGRVVPSDRFEGTPI